MNKAENHKDRIEKLLNDPEFARRTAAAVSEKAAPTSGLFQTGWAVAAALVVAVGIFYLKGGLSSTEEYAGLGEDSASSVVRESKAAWDDTDNIINASLTID